MPTPLRPYDTHRRRGSTTPIQPLLLSFRIPGRLAVKRHRTRPLDASGAASITTRPLPPSRFWLASTISRRSVTLPSSVSLRASLRRSDIKVLRSSLRRSLRSSSSNFYGVRERNSTIFPARASTVSLRSSRWRFLRPRLRSCSNNFLRS